jgi:trehalose 6-phosphate synthase
VERRPMKLIRLGPALGYPILALLLAIGLAVAAAPFSGRLIQQWSRSDVEARSRLAFNSIQGPVVRALHDKDQERLTGILQSVSLDERILAVGLCDSRGRLRAQTSEMPRSFSCEQAPRSESESFSTFVQGGRNVLLAAFPIVADGGRFDLVVLHDLSYVHRRSGRVQTYVAAGLTGVVLLVAMLAAALIVLLLRGWMAALRKAVEDVRAGRPGAGTLQLSPLDLEIQRMLKALDVGKPPTEAAEAEWTPLSLTELLGGALPGAEVIVVSNREPYIHNVAAGGVVLQTPASGMVTALEPVMRACGGTWIAHGSGTADRVTVDAEDHVAVPPEAPAYTLRRVWVSEEEQDGYYYGLANEGLWPLCHIAFVRPVFRESDWQSYVTINQRFADAVVREARTEDPLVLVQDYHFALAPKMIRERLPKATIITFWHIPWPNAETFGICPWKEAILEGLLGSSILGFHTQFHCNNFIETVDRFIESRIDREHHSVTLGGHETRVRSYPISIAWPPKALESQPGVAECRHRVRQELGIPDDVLLAVGIERFDYTKGIVDRMRAVELLLENHPQWRGRFSFVQVAAPTRSKLPSYAALQREAVAAAEAVNERYGRPGYKPIHLIIRHHEPTEVFRLFRAAELCIVSSLHDGMNLVAKEFVASRDDEQGVLVLSSFTGASRELSEALIVNPYDGREMAEAIHAGLVMPAPEQRERMRVMRTQVREQNVYRWAGRMLVDAAKIRQRQRILGMGAHAI